MEAREPRKSRQGARRSVQAEAGTCQGDMVTWSDGHFAAFERRREELEAGGIQRSAAIVQAFGEVAEAIARAAERSR